MKNMSPEHLAQLVVIQQQQVQKLISQIRLYQEQEGIGIPECYIM